MNKYIITTATLLAAAVAANAWTTALQNQIWEQNTDEIEYQYSLVQNSVFTTHSVYTNGATTEVKVEDPYNNKVDFNQDARYEISFEVTHNKRGNDRNAASVMLTLVSTGNDVCLAFGNGPNNGLLQAGALVGNPSVADVPNTPAKEALTYGTFGRNVWTPPGYPTYAQGDYQYTVIFETFADSSINDKIYFGVTNENTGQSVSFLKLNASHLGAGAPTTKVFDDIGFLLIGDKSNGADTVDGSAILVGTEGTTRNNYFKKWTRTATAIPEPSAFGLLAGLGALALVGTRRRNRR